MTRPTERAHQVVAEVLRAGESAVDATAGNGHDTLFLAECVGAEGRVLAFDVQRAAIESARARVVGAGIAGRVEFFEESHGKLLQRAGREAVGAVMFNLGYLPGGDHAVTTEVGESCKAVVQGVFALREGGVMTVVCYTGHPGGGEEADAVVLGLREIQERGEVAIEVEVMEPAREKAPFLVVVRRWG